MKPYNLKNYLIIPFILFTYFSFGQRLIIPEEVFKPESFSNKVINVSSCLTGYGTVDSFNTNGLLTYSNSGWFTKYSYNEKGLLIGEISESKQNGYWDDDHSSKSYKYDSYGNLTSAGNYLMYARDGHYTTKNYDNTYKDSLLITTVSYYVDQSYNAMEIGGNSDTLKSELFYDSLNRMYKQEDKHGSKYYKDYVYLYKYTDKNQLSTIEQFLLVHQENNAANIYVPDYSDTLKCIKYDYDDSGKIIKRVETGENPKFEKYRYSNGKMIEKEIEELKGTEKTIFVYKYTYDAFGNVLKVDKYTNDGKFLSNIITRAYTYLKK